MLEDFSSVESEYRMLIINRLDTHYPLISDLFWEEWVNKVVELEMKNTLNMYDDIEDETEYKLDINQDIHQLFMSWNLADYNKWLERLFEECASREMPPMSLDKKYSDDQLKQKAVAWELTAIELYWILKMRNVVEHFKEHWNRIMQCPFKGIVKKLQESIILGFGVMKPRS